jgi:lipoate-protein ligase B
MTNDPQEGWIVDLGHARYLEVLDLQRTLVELRHENTIPDTLLLVEHEPVITLGRRGRTDNILSTAEILASEGIQIYRLERGGDVTYHGPGQVVGYPIMHLGQRKLTIRMFVDLLEETVILTLADFDIGARREPQHRGVWVGNLKVAALGVAVRRWVSFHGFALNVSPRMDHYCHINPCELGHERVTSMSSLLGKPPSLAVLTQKLISKFVRLFPGNWYKVSFNEFVEKVKMHEVAAQSASALMINDQ